MIEAKIYDVHCSDIWSCVEIMFALVCGFIPFEDQNTQALFQTILHARHCHPSTLAAECRKIITKNREITPPPKSINIPGISTTSLINLLSIFFIPEGGEKGDVTIDSKLLLEKKQREAQEARTVSKLTPITENVGEPKGVVKVEHVVPIEGRAKAALSKRKTAAKIVTSNQPSGEAKGANEPAAEEKKESDEKNKETVKKKVTTSKNVH
ncbi:hypothetical protein BLNAU_17572 [Blattamonas nauphoetae]|uniref:Protein kinase domain-containing protein n=1 Tax=Blattamonas nauphoetae TaxID=2049346 RepID=A0ABQ9XB28_9EUKA|nr:hypothetical protein BLNAU_17572 [Blattamonas nauphoetae]